ncbi:MAG: T9SS type A sorting domain-containing protein [Bacteroidota bacterium]|nr:T9SS type A sorting domain-containing protein [Bacteroidota bacterium]
MMKLLKLTTILILIAIANLAFAQTVTINYSQKIGGDSNDYFIKNRIAHNQFWSVGYTQSGDITSRGGKISTVQAWLYGCSMNGDSILSKKIIGSNSEQALDVIEGGVNNVIVVGYTMSNDGDFASANHYGGADAFLSVIDTLGNFMYIQKYGGSNTDIIHRIIRTSSGNFLMIGQSKSNDGSLPDNGNTDTDGWIYLLDESLDSVWSKKVGMINEQAFYDAVATESGGFIVTGILEPSTGTDEAYFWILKFNSIGEIQWEITAGGSAFDRPIGLYECNDGNYMAYGFSNSDDGLVHDHIGGADGYVVKFSPVGDTLWTKSLGWSDSGEIISDLFEYDGKYYAVMTSDQSTSIDNYGENDIVLLEFDQDNQYFVNHFGGDNIEPAYEGGGISVEQGIGNEFFFSTSTLSDNYDLSGTLGEVDAWIFSIDFLTGKTENLFQREINVYPNPAKNIIQLELSKYESFPIGYTIIDNQGKLVQKGLIYQPSETIDIQDLPQGAYHIKTGNPYCKANSFVKN